MAKRIARKRRPTVKRSRSQTAVEEGPNAIVVLNYFKLTDSFDQDDEEDLDVTILANGQQLYICHNTNHGVNDREAEGRFVTLVGVKEIHISGSVTCADYFKPFYGAASRVHTEPFEEKPQTLKSRVPIGTDGFGGWEIEYQIISLKR
jgi:hypothetical protein